jgi:hypothetical protein
MINWVLRALALSRALKGGEVWRGGNCGLRTLSGSLPSKFGVQGFSLEKNFFFANKKFSAIIFLCQS